MAKDLGAAEDREQAVEGLIGSLRYLIIEAERIELHAIGGALRGALSELEREQVAPRRLSSG